MKWIGFVFFLCQFLNIQAEEFILRGSEIFNFERVEPREFSRSSEMKDFTAPQYKYQVDEEVIQGELSNGLTYYVRHNGYPQKSAALRLIVKVGSIYEKENEKGVAHIVEHMVFRGSRHFADEESIKYLESIGAWYGPDTNASTGFESTHYEINIPLEKEGVLEKALLILSDFAAYATLSEEALEAERGVVLNELHQRTGTASWRLFEKRYNFLTAGSNYENHFPIGLLDVVQTASAEVIRDFYHRWYRPDRMAVIAVGDFDPEKIVQLIEKLFGAIPCPEEEVEEPPFEIESPLHSKVLVHYDPELTSTDLSLVAFIPSVTENLDLGPSQSPGAGQSQLVLCQRQNLVLGGAKATGLHDRKTSCIELIQRGLRSCNRESFRTSPTLNFDVDRALARISNTGDVEIVPAAGAFASVQNQVFSHARYTPNEEDSDDFSFEEAKKSIISYLALSLLDGRLDKLSDESTSSVLSAGAEEVPITAFYSTISIGGSFFQNRWRDGVKAIHEEILRASKYGFTMQEWQNFQKRLLRHMRFQLQNLDKREHEEFVEEYIDHFLEGGPLFDLEWSLRWSLGFVENLSIEDINEVTMPWDKQNYWLITLSTPSREIVDQASFEFLLASFQTEDRDGLSPSTEEMVPKNILGTIDSVGHISALSEDEVLGVTYMTLNNGVKFVLKPSDFEKGSIEIYAEAEHGYASLSQELFHSARLSVPYFFRSGLGNLNGHQLYEYLQTEGIGLYVGIDHNSRSIVLSSHDEDKRPLFELLHALFTVPNFDTRVWDKLVDQTHECIKERLNDPLVAFSDFIYQVNTQNHFLFQPLNLQKAEAKMSQKVFERAFGRPSDFTFVIVGDFDLEEMKKLAIEYVGSIPTKEVEPLPSFKIPVFFPRVSKEIKFKLGSLPHCETVISIPFDFDQAFNHFGNNSYVHAAKVIFEQRLTQILRKKMGGTYHVGVSIVSLLAPSRENSVLKITFSSPQAEIDKMVKNVFFEISKMRGLPPEEEEVATVRELFLADRRMGEQLNSYWISAIQASEQCGVPLSKILNFEERIALITPEIIHEAARYLFMSPHYTILSHIPEMQE